MLIMNHWSLHIISYMMLTPQLAFPVLPVVNLTLIDLPGLTKIAVGIYSLYLFSALLDSLVVTSFI